MENQLSIHFLQLEFMLAELRFYRIKGAASVSEVEVKHKTRLRSSSSSKELLLSLPFTPPFVLLGMGECLKVHKFTESFSKILQKLQ